MRTSGKNKPVEVMKRGYKLSTIEKSCYKIFKMQWLKDHTSEEERTNAQKEYFANIMDIQFKKSYPTFDSWIEEIGYTDGIYPSKEEFLDNEFKDGDYMAELLIDDVRLYDCYVSHGAVFQAEDSGVVSEILTSLADEGRILRKDEKSSEKDYYPDDENYWYDYIWKGEND